MNSWCPMSAVASGDLGALSLRKRELSETSALAAATVTQSTVTRQLLPVLPEGWALMWKQTCNSKQTLDSSRS